MQELNVNEVLEVSGGRRNLGTLYQYTGDPADRTLGEIWTDLWHAAADFVLRDIYQY